MKYLNQLVSFPFIGLALVAFTGCGKSASEPLAGQKLEIDAYNLFDRGTLVTTDAGVAGTGRLLFKLPVPYDDNNYALKFSLKPGGSLTLEAGTTDQMLRGLTLTFSRTVGDTFEVKLAVDTETKDLSAHFAGVSAAEPLSLEIDVHEHAHMMIWVNGGEEQNHVFGKKPQGTLWGLSLKDASVTKAKVGEAKDKH